MNKKFYMRSGVIVDFGLPKIDLIPLGDILHSLAKELRFHGQSDCSVLQHSIVTGVVASCLGCNPLLVKHAYVHDFPEAFLRDLPSMVKTKDYLELESEVYGKLLDAMNMPKLGIDDKDTLRQIDLHARLVETHFMFGDIGLYEAVSEEVAIDSRMLIETTLAWVDIAETVIFDETGEVNPEVLEIFKQILGPF